MKLDIILGSLVQTRTQRITQMKSSEINIFLSALSEEAVTDLRNHILKDYFQGLIAKKSDGVDVAAEPVKANKVSVSSEVKHTNRRGPTGNGLSKFIRQHPDLTVNEVIAEGAKVGLKISAPLIYGVRSRDAKAAVSVEAPVEVESPVESPVIEEAVEVSE